MKFDSKQSLWLLVVTAIFFVGSLAACQPTTEQASVSPTAEAEIQNPAETIEPTAAALVVLENAVTTDSGLQYLELVPGEGAAPVDENIVSMHFIVTLPDGAEVFNSYNEGEPAIAIMGRNQMLPGWEEGLRLMKAGGKAKLALPAELAFGGESSGIIPANSQIIMEVELISVKEAPMPTQVTSNQLTTTASGLQYYDIVVGDGMEAVTGTLVSSGYSIWVLGENQYMFVVSSEEAAPARFSLGRGGLVFPGWEEGISGMKVGGKRYLVIPPALGLGDQSSGDIPAGATLVMEIELIEAQEPLKATVVDEKDYITTESGLKYYDLKVGEGPTPASGETVLVHYSGWLTDGTLFDSSVESGEPFSFQLGMGGVIAGWDEGLATMKVGGKRQLVIPAELGYGETGSGSMIPPGATLIFEVELLEIQP